MSLARFTDKELDESGLYYFNARYYDPKTQRFATEDPIKDINGFYNYCFNDPINNTDFDGKEAWPPEAPERSLMRIEAAVKRGLMVASDVVKILGVGFAGEAMRRFQTGSEYDLQMRIETRSEAIKAAMDIKGIKVEGTVGLGITMKDIIAFSKYAKSMNLIAVVLGGSRQTIFSKRDGHIYSEEFTPGSSNSHKVGSDIDWATIGSMTEQIRASKGLWENLPLQDTHGPLFFSASTGLICEVLPANLYVQNGKVFAGKPGNSTLVSTFNFDAAGPEKSQIDKALKDNLLVIYPQTSNQFGFIDVSSSRSH